jgi:hypothetical protein
LAGALAVFVGAMVARACLLPLGLLLLVAFARAVSSTGTFSVKTATTVSGGIYAVRSIPARFFSLTDLYLPVH